MDECYKKRKMGWASILLVQGILKACMNAYIVPYGYGYGYQNPFVTLEI